MTETKPDNAGRRRRITLLVALALLAAPTAYASGAISNGSSGNVTAAATGSLGLAPATGDMDLPVNVTIPEPCPTGADSVIVQVSGGGFPTGSNALGVTDITVDPSMVSFPMGSWSTVAANNQTAVSALTGTANLKLICLNGATAQDYTASVTFTGTPKTYTVVGESATPTPSPTPGATPTPSPTPAEATPTPTPAATPTPSPTPGAGTPTPTPEVTPTPTATPAASPTPQPSVSPTPTPIDLSQVCRPGSPAPAGFALQEGTPGDDVLTGGPGPDLLRGLAGDDILIGSDGNDILCGGAGDDLLSGRNGHDLIRGEAGRDVVYGGAGNDVITGDSGQDVLDGGNGNDVILGGSGADLIRGGNGDDLLFGDAGNDRIFGEDGSDRLYGGPGRDLLVVAGRAK